MSLAIARLFVLYFIFLKLRFFNLYPVHSYVVYLRLRHSARSTRTLWTSLHNKRLITVYSSFTVFNGHLILALVIDMSLAIARLFVLYGIF